MRGVLLAACLSLIATSAQGQDAKARIDGGPAQGMLMGKVVSTEGEFQLVALEPSLPDASPIPTELRASVDALLVGDRSKDFTPLRGMLADAAYTRFCPLDERTMCEPDHPFDGFAVPERDRANTPYYMPDGRVRIEWLAGNEVRFMSFLVFANGKLKSVETAPAIMAMKKNG